MTATRTTRSELATLVVLAVAGVTAGWFLWRTTVPSDLHLGGLDEHRFFGQHTLHRTAHFENFLRVDWALAVVAELAALAIFAWRARGLAGTLPVGRVGRGIILALVAMTVAWGVGVPFGIAANWWERRYGISKAGYAEFVIGPWLVLPASVLAICLLVAIVMGLAGSRLHRMWWVAGAPVLTAIVVGLTFVTPYLDSLDTDRVHGTLARDARELERTEGTGHVPVYVEDVSDETTAANAFTTGFGPTKRVVLWNTLTEHYPHAEVRAVLGHELGHVASRHILKGLAWFAIFAFVLAYAVERATRRLGGMASPAAVPVAAFVLVAAQLVLAPFYNVVSRRYEAEADWRALQATHDPRAMQALFQRFSRKDLQEPNPPGWDYVLLEDHPTTMQRIAMAREWAARHGERLP